MIEIAQLKEDNKRLMDMLRGTREFKDFGGFVEDSGGDVRHIEGPQRRASSTAANDIPSNNQQQSSKPPFQSSFNKPNQTRASFTHNRASSASKILGEKGGNKSSMSKIPQLVEETGGDLIGDAAEQD